MITQLEVVRLIAPEFSAVSDEDVQKFIDMASLYLDAELVPEDRRGLVLALKACSLMVDRAASEDGASHGGNLTREKEGDLERGYSYGGASGKASAKNIYEQQLDTIYAGVLGGNVMVRYGLAG